MNNWMLPHIREELREIEEFKVQKKLEEERKSFVENLSSPNYVLIDAALWDIDIEIVLSNNSIMYKSLFRGSTGEKLWSVAPYLVDISANEEFVKVIKSKDPIERRVTWLRSPENMDDLRKHLRRFLRMKKEDGSYIYFRFYDPYVANVVFPNLTKEQAMAFFDKIEYVATEDIRSGEKQIFRLSSEKEIQIISQNLDSHVDNKQ